MERKEQLLKELETYIRSDGKGGKTTAKDLREFLSSLIDEIYARNVSIPPICASDGDGKIVYQGSSLYDAISKVPDGAGLIMCFANVSLDLPEEKEDREVILPISTTIICHYGILTLQNNTLTLTARCRLVQARVQRGTIRSAYAGVDGNTPKFEGGVSYGVPLEVVSGAIIVEGVSFAYGNEWLKGTGKGVLRGSTFLNRIPNIGNTEVIDERAGVKE